MLAVSLMNVFLSPSPARYAPPIQTPIMYNPSIWVHPQRTPAKPFHTNLTKPLLRDHYMPIPLIHERLLHGSALCFAQPSHQSFLVEQ